MSALFGDDSKAGKTILVVDVENGSVASALVRLSSTENPKLFAEHRVALPVRHSISSMMMFEEVKKALAESLEKTGAVAARIRQNKQLAQQGIIGGAHVFLSPPWTTTAQGSGGMEWDFEPHVITDIRRSIETITGDTPLRHHSLSWAAAHAASSLIEGRLLLCIVTGEIVELLVVEDGRIDGRATVPIGLHTLLRTLTTHTGVSIAEARSALRLYQHSSADPLAFQEPLRAAADHFVEQFTDVAETLLSSYPVSTIVVIAQEPAGEWFARALAAHAAIARLFPAGGTTRDIRAKHLKPYVTTHETSLDVQLMLEALFAHSLHRSEYGIKY